MVKDSEKCRLHAVWFKDKGIFFLTHLSLQIFVDIPPPTWPDSASPEGGERLREGAGRRWDGDIMEVGKQRKREGGGACVRIGPWPRSKGRGIGTVQGVRRQTLNCSYDNSLYIISFKGQTCFIATGKTGEATIEASVQQEEESWCWSEWGRDGEGQGVRVSVAFLSWEGKHSQSGAKLVRFATLVSNLSDQIFALC